jgi:hypothetical protein
MTQRISSEPKELYNTIGFQKLGDIKERKRHKRVKSGCSINKTSFSSPGHTGKQMKKSLITLYNFFFIPVKITPSYSPGGII